MLQGGEGECSCSGTLGLSETECAPIDGCDWMASSNECSCNLYISQLTEADCNEAGILDQMNLANAIGANGTAITCVFGGTGTGTGTTGGTGTGTGTTGGTGTGTGAVDSTVESQTQELPNFLGTTDINEVIGRIVKAIIGISGSFALAVFIYGGTIWMFSGGNTSRIQKGRNAMIYASIGLAVIFLSYTLVSYVLRALK